MKFMAASVVSLSVLEIFVLFGTVIVPVSLGPVLYNGVSIGALQLIGCLCLVFAAFLFARTKKQSRTTADLPKDESIVAVKGGSSLSFCRSFALRASVFLNSCINPRFGNVLSYGAEPCSDNHYGDRCFCIQGEAHSEKDCRIDSCNYFDDSCEFVNNCYKKARMRSCLSVTRATFLSNYENVF